MRLGKCIQTGLDFALTLKHAWESLSQMKSLWLILTRNNKEGVEKGYIFFCNFLEVVPIKTGTNWWKREALHTHDYKMNKKHGLDSGLVEFSLQKMP